MLIAALLIGLYGFLSDYPADIQHGAPEPTRRQRVQCCDGLLAVRVT